MDWVKSVFARLKASGAVNKDIIKLEQKFIRLAETAKKQRVKDEAKQGNNTSGKSQYLFAGESAKTADKFKLSTAKQMLKDGADSETIRKETGWFKGYDGKWRFEINDKDVDIRAKNVLDDILAYLNFSNLKVQLAQGIISTDEYVNKTSEALDADWNNRTLKDYFKHKKLFEAYPELEEISIQFNFLNGKATGAYDQVLNCIWLEPRVIEKPNARDILIKSLIHETQHAIQRIEGFTKGASGVYWKAMTDKGKPPRYQNGKKMTYEAAYKNTAGEIEAYDASRRYLLDDNERRDTRPDIDRKNVVFADEEIKEFVPLGIKNMQYSIPSDHNYVYTNGKASFTEERLNNLFDEHSLGDGKRAEHSNAYVGYISPEDFVSLTSNKNIRSRVEDEAYVLNEEELRNETETPFIEYDPASGEVVGHEGRHRMVALKADGIESVAILLKPSNDSFERRTVQDISLIGQNFAEGRAVGKVTVKTAVPLSEKYREKAMQKFAKNPDADVRYSLPDNKYANYNKPITIEDIQTLRSIGRKSINNFTSADIEQAQKWAYKFYQQLGEKSPFFRAWFGDWRAYDKTPVEIVDVPNLPFGTDLFKEFVKQQSGEIYNEDTKGNNDNGWKIRISREGRENTISHSGGKRLSARALTAVRELVAKSVLLDTEVHEHHSNNSKTAQTDRIAFDHRLYALGRTSNGDINLYRITVEEIFQDPKHPNDMRFHNLKYIEKVAENIGSLTADKQRAESASDVSTTNYSISNLFDFVKRNDRDFNLGETSIDVNLLNEDGTPKKFYHGTNEEFTEFNPDEFASREGSFFFAENKEDAKAYGNNVFDVYLTGKKFADYDNQPSEFYQLRNKREQVEYLKERGYDGWYADMDSGGWGEVSVFSNTQIKSATDNIGTFDKTEGDIRYSIPDIARGKTAPELLKMANNGEITSDDALKVLADEYGTMPKGESPKVDVDVPNKVSDKRGVRRFARTALLMHRRLFIKQRIAFCICNMVDSLPILY